MFQDAEGNVVGNEIQVNTAVTKQDLNEMLKQLIENEEEH